MEGQIDSTQNKKRTIVQMRAQDLVGKLRSKRKYFLFLWPFFLDDIY